MIEAKFKTKILLKDSLREMPIGSKLTIKNRQFKASVVRTKTTDLKCKEGYLFDVSDRGMIDEVVVTRIK